MSADNVQQLPGSLHLIIKSLAAEDELRWSKLCIMCLPSKKAAPIYASHYFYTVIIA